MNAFLGKDENDFTVDIFDNSACAHICLIKLVRLNMVDSRNYYNKCCQLYF